jgi:hypothetical protein
VIKILYFDGCPNLDGLETRIRALVDRLGYDTPIEARRIASDAQAHEEHFLGSPTVRVNGIDVEPDAETRHAYGLVCRMYRTDEGLRHSPPDEWIATALQTTRLTPPSRRPSSTHRGADRACLVKAEYWSAVVWLVAVLVCCTPATSSSDYSGRRVGLDPLGGGHERRGLVVYHNLAPPLARPRPADALLVNVPAT